MRDTEAFWAGEFGDAYIERNRGRVRANEHFFSRALGIILTAHKEPHSVLEFGAGAGENLLALRAVLSTVSYPSFPLFIRMTGIEINKAACAELATVADQAICESFLDWQSGGRTWDLVLSKGLLIHVAPGDLQLAYQKIHATAGRYILIAEYFNPTPVEVPYRGHAGRLWKRDFAGELLDAYQDLHLLDYGFVYHRDPLPQDDLHWFLLERR